MIDERDLVERTIRALAPEQPSFAGLMDRRDRKRRDRRLAAAAVGIAVAVAIVALGSSILRSTPPPDPVPVDWPTRSLVGPPVLQPGEVLSLAPGRGTLVALHAATGRTRTLARCQGDCRAIVDPSASAGGGWVTYDVWTCITTCDPVEPDQGIWLVGADGQPRHLDGVSEWGSAWSPTTQLLAYVGDDDYRSLFLLDPLSDERTRIATSDAQIYAIAWSPDGRTIAFTVDDGPSSEGIAREELAGLYVVRSGEDPTRISPRRGIEGIAWSPDGSSLALDVQGGGGLVVVVGADGSGELEVVRGPRSEGPSGPVWSPDSTRIAFVRTPKDERGKYVLEFWIIDRDGGSPTRLGRFPHFDSWPASVWSPDGERLAFSPDGERWFSARTNGQGTPTAIDLLQVVRWRPAKTSAR